MAASEPRRETRRGETPERGSDTPTVVEPAGWRAPRGYANGVAARGRILFVAGQIGWNPSTGTLAGSDFPAQARQALANIVAVLHAGGARPGDLVRLTWYVTDRAEYRAARGEVGRAYRAMFGGHYPAMTLVEVSGLLEDGAKVEIEATAVVPD